MLVWMIILGLQLGEAYGGTCREAYDCSRTCYKSTKYYTRCGFLYLSRCRKYRSQKETCISTCYRTKCCTGYTGSGCNSPICFGSTTCLNGGTCITPNNCGCQRGFAAPNCDDINECSGTAHGCDHSCVNTHGSYHCTCRSGYTLNSDLKTCLDVNECNRNKGDCEQICYNNIGSYTCDCSRGYKLNKDRKTCTDVNECTTGTSGCAHLCTNTVGSYTCSCRTGYVLALDRKKCEDIDECTEQTSGCSQICNNVDGSYTCSCIDGYFLDSDDKTCIDEDDCDGVLCQNGGSCVDGLDSFKCICNTGFTGVFCQTDTNECKILNGGCQDICINTIGSFVCNCSEGSELKSDGFSCAKEGAITVFQRLQIPRQFLPEACFTVMLVQCIDGNDIDIYLTSTSEWYRLNSDSDVIYTFGIVFVKVNNFSVPVSIRGIEVNMRRSEFVYSFGVQYGSALGSIIVNGYTSADCRSFELVESDIFDFISVDSFTKTLLLSLFPTLPGWLTFEKSSTEILSVQDIKTDLVYGRNMDDITWCTGAPVLSDHLYTVFRFGTGFKLSVLGNELDFPKTFKSRKFCLIVDLCQSYGGTVFMMIPEGSRDLLLELSVFRTLKEDQNIKIEPRGIGISLVNGINAGYLTFSHQLWNGDAMFLPLLPQLDFWIGGKLMKYDNGFTVEGNADIYFGIPSVQSMLTAMFREEWTGVIDIQLSAPPILKFKLFGKEYSVTLKLETATVNAYISFGDSNRQWCGEVSNPQGVFLSAMLEINPFKGVPLLQEFVISSSHRLYAFVATDPKENPLEGIKLNVRDDILELDKLLNHTLIVLNDAVHDLRNILSDSLVEALIEIKQSVIITRKIVSVNLGDLLSENFEMIMASLEDIRQRYYQLRDVIDNFLDKTEFIVNDVKDNLTEMLKRHVRRIRENIKDIFSEITQRTISSAGNYAGFGLKFSTDVELFGLTLSRIDIEIVYSEKDLLQCSRFHKVKRLLDGESALRFLGRASRGMKLGKFLKIEEGYRLEGAFAQASDNGIIQLQVFVNMIGIKVTWDLFISRNGIYFYLEGNVWDIFLAQIDVSAVVGKDWNQLTFTCTVDLLQRHGKSGTYKL